MISLAERLRAARLAAGLTQVEAAARLGATQTYWSQLECGRRVPSAAQILLIAYRLGWPIADIDPALAKSASKSAPKITK